MPAKARGLADVFGDIARRRGDDVKGDVDERARRRPLPLVARTIERVGCSARLG